MEEFLPSKKVCEILGVHPRSLYVWEAKKIIETIRTPGGKRLYNVKKYLLEQERNIEKNKINFKNIKNKNQIEDIIDNKQKIIYARVSSLGQADDLTRQINKLQNAYPEYLLIKDIGSGMNMNRKGLRKIIDLAIRNVR